MRLNSRIVTAMLASALAVASPLAAHADGNATSSRVYAVLIAGRPIDAAGEYAIARNGVVSADLVDLTRALGGVIMYRDASAAEIRVNHKRLRFTVGSTTAELDGIPITIAAAPFLENGRFFVPLRTLALTAGFSVGFDRAHAQINLGLPAVSAAPTPVAGRVSIAVTASAAADGLHLIASVRNLTVGTLELSFPTSARVEFTAVRAGNVLWRSTASVRVLESKSRLVFSAGETKAFAATWPGYRLAGPAPISVRAQLLSEPHVYSPALIVAGAPLPTPGPTATSAATMRPAITPPATPSPVMPSPATSPTASVSPTPVPAIIPAVPAP